jgi:hypothetical protein
MERPLECLRCKTHMLVGLVIDQRYVLPSRWVEGDPKRTWYGLLEIKGKPLLEIKTYRCS